MALARETHRPRSESPRGCRFFKRKGGRKISGILRTFSLPALEKAIETNILEQVRLLAGPSPQVRIHDASDMVWITSDVPHPFLNRIYRARLDPEDVDRRVAETVAYFASRDLPMSWHVGPASQPDDLGEHLTTHGLIHRGDEIGMAIDLLGLDEHSAPPSGLVIERVGDVETLREWLHVVAVSFQYPESVVSVLFDAFGRQGFGQGLPWRLHVGFLNEEPVGASRLFLGAGVAGIYAVATVPDERRQGIGTAMTFAALGEACGMGYRIGVLRAAPAGLAVYRRLGFSEWCRFGIYEWAGGVDSGRGLGDDVGGTPPGERPQRGRSGQGSGGLGRPPGRGVVGHSLTLDSESGRHRV